MSDDESFDQKHEDVDDSPSLLASIGKALTGLRPTPSATATPVTAATPAKPGPTPGPSSASRAPKQTPIDLKDVERFYKGRMQFYTKTPDKFDYDEEGNLIEREKNAIIKTIRLPTYRRATPEELQETEDERMQRILEKNAEFDAARVALYDEYKNPDRTFKSIFELNRKVAEKDIELKFEQYAHQYVRIVNPKDKNERRITMKELHFEDANEKKNVYDKIAILETRTTSLLLDMRVDQESSNMVDLYKAKADAEIKEKKMAGLKKVLRTITKTDENIEENAEDAEHLATEHEYRYLNFAEEIPTVKPTMMTRDEIMQRLTKKPNSVKTSVKTVTAPAAKPLVKSSKAIIMEESDDETPVPAAVPAAVPATVPAAVPAVVPASKPLVKSSKAIVMEESDDEAPAPVTKPLIKSSKVIVMDDSNSSPNTANAVLKKKVNVGRVFIASKTPPRQPGKRVEPPTPMKAVDVTSGQATDSATRRDFSPMTPVEGGYKGYWNFEHYWQSGKVFEGVDVKTARAWWKKQVEPKRRYPGSKDLRVLHACWDPSCSDKMDWVTSRKRIYAPEYFELMKDRPSAIALRDYVASGKDVVVYDYDGPRNPDRSNSIMEVTVENLQEKINATDFPFGHGYIVAAWLKGITPDQYS